jgi:ABC-type transport system involved in multi-copper enzyme maturation permease subunit
VICHILAKEVLRNLLSLRFALAMLLSLALFAASSIVSVHQHRQESQDYWRRTNENLAELSVQAEQLYKLAFYQQKVWKKPKALALCAGGGEKYLPPFFVADVFRIDLRELESQGNFLLPTFSDVDWVFIIATLFSFVAISFTYDAFSGERQAGTLRLTLSHSVPRHAVFLGKYLGALVSLGIPLLAGLLVSLIVVVTSGVTTIAASQWGAILAIVVLSVLYLSLFALAGLFVSSRTAHPATGIVILLCVWVSLVLLIPSLGRILSDTYYRSPSLTEFYRRVVETKEQIFADMEAGKYGQNAFESHPDRNHPSNNPPAAARFWNAFVESIDRIHEDQHNRMLTQARAGRRIARVSPVAIYQQASETIAGTGVERYARLYRQIRNYQDALKTFILDKDAEDPNSLHLLFPFDYAVEHWEAISKRPVDFSTVPKFQEREPVVGQSLKLAIWDVSLLVLLNLVFFAAAFVSFLHYDVR